MDMFYSAPGNKGRTPSQEEERGQELLNRLTQCKAVFDARLLTQLPLLEVLEQYLVSNLRTHYSQGNINQHFIEVVLDAVLQRMIDGKAVARDEALDTPYIWPGARDPGLPAERREAVIQAVDTTAMGFVEHYRDYLLGHWQIAGDEASLAQVINTQLYEHMVAYSAVFSAGQLAGLSVDELRGKIEAVQDAWHRTGHISRLATTDERVRLDALVRLQLPHWLRVLKEPDRQLLMVLEVRTSQARALVDELFEGLDSLPAYARRLAKDYVRFEKDIEIEPNGIQVQLQWQEAVSKPLKTYTLTELLAKGPVRSDSFEVLSVSRETTLRNEPLSIPFLSQMLGDVDAPAGYLQALTGLYSRADFNDAMQDWYEARLRQSAAVANFAGHLSETSHDQLKSHWPNETSLAPASSLRVTGIKLPIGLNCADLLLFYREDKQGAATNLLLYAPRKPDGQEWIEVVGLRALSGEIAGWTRNEVGRAYLLQQLEPSSRGRAEGFFAEVANKPISWNSSIDLRTVATDFKAAIKGSVAMGLANVLKQVELSESPRWYSALALDSRQVIGSLNHCVRINEELFNEQLVNYEVFRNFAKRTVAQDIASYMRSKGVSQPVDPGTVLIEYYPGLGSRQKVVASLLDLAIHGYDDNSGIEHPHKGVHSSVGQDLKQVRSADLAIYIRRAYLGEKYAEHIRKQFLAAGDPAYLRRRSAFTAMLLVKIDRDLRVAYAKSLLNAAEFSSLARQVTLLGAVITPRHPANPEDVVSREGLIKLTIGGHVVLGVYVFALFNPTGMDAWLYLPDAPDNIVFRKYSSLFGPVITPLHNYILDRVALTARSEVRRLLRGLMRATSHVNTLRELHRVTDIRTEFDAYIERSVSDVEDITTSRSEMIEGLVLKGLYFAAIPISLVLPPFALLLDAAFVAFSSSQAIRAHIKGDTEGALMHWLEAAWGALLGSLGFAPASRALAATSRTLKIATRALGSVQKPVRPVTAVLAKGVGPVVRPVRFKPSQAVKATPENLQLVTEPGIFQGTYRSPPNAAQRESTYFIRSRGKYYQVARSRYFESLCLVDASRPGAIYQLPIRKMANGQWTRARVGLRGGNDEVRNLGRVSDLRMAFPDHANPQLARGALQGEAVVAQFSESAAENYLYSLNAQQCVIASLYNPTTKMGAVIHYDHNVRSLLESSVKEVLNRLGGPMEGVRATLVGGDWLLSGVEIGGPLRKILREQGLRPTWDYWSYSSCLGNIYGVSLDLKTGVTSVFKTSLRQVEDFYRPVQGGVADINMKSDLALWRVNWFQGRVKQGLPVEGVDGVVRTPTGGLYLFDELDSFRFRIYTPT